MKLSDEQQPGAATDTAAEEQPGAEPGDTESFPREYVEKLRAENAKYRTAAKDTQVRLHEALVAATGRLQDPRDLQFDAAHLETPEALTQAINALLEERPHLKARKVSGDAGQGVRGSDTSPPSFADLLRS